MERQDLAASRRRQGMEQFRTSSWMVWVVRAAGEMQDEAAAAAA